MIYDCGLTISIDRVCFLLSVVFLILSIPRGRVLFL
jgi:hypothetical protein